MTEEPQSKTNTKPCRIKPNQTQAPIILSDFIVVLFIFLLNFKEVLFLKLYNFGATFESNSSQQMVLDHITERNKGRFCNTIASVALVHTSIQSD